MAARRFQIQRVERGTGERTFLDQFTYDKSLALIDIVPEDDPRFIPGHTDDDNPTNDHPDHCININVNVTVDDENCPDDQPSTPEP